jgi:hypothetical protein
MCYMTLLSTDSPEDLGRGNNDLVRFSRELPGLPEEADLEHAHRWLIGSRHGCSCGFRHLYVGSVDLGFGEPQDWYPEEPEDLEATLQVIATIRQLVSGGARVDCIDAWAHGEATARLSGTVHVDLATLGDRSFRLFENHRFVFER